MTAPLTPNPNTAPRPLSPGETLLRQPLEVPELGQPTTPEQQQAELNAAAGHLNKILQAQAHDARTTRNLDRSYNQYATVYGDWGVFDDIAAYGDEQRALNSDNIAQEHGVPQAEAELRKLLAHGNTGAVVTLMNALGQQTENMYHENRGDYTDKGQQHRAALDAVDVAAEATLLTRRTKVPHGVKKPGEKDMPDYYAPRKEHKAYRKAQHDYFRAEIAAKERDAETALPHAAAVSRAHKLESDVVTAADQVVASHRMMERMDTLFADERREYVEKLDRLTALHEEVAQELGTWGFGYAPADKDQRGRLALLFDQWSQELEGMSLQDVNRHTSLGDWVTERTRFEQRRALTMLRNGGSSYPYFTDDRGVAVRTTDVEHVLHDDGSITDRKGERRWPDGAEWRQPEATPSITLEELAAEPTDKLLNIRAAATAIWETERTPESEVDAAITSRAVTENFNLHLDIAQGNFDTARTTLTERTAAYQHAVDNRMTLIDAHVEELRRAEPDRDLTDMRNEAVATVQSRIASLEQARNDAQDAVNEAQDALRLVREDLNASEYLRYFFGVNRPDEAGVEEGTRARITHGGLVYLENGALHTANGETRGNWVIFPNGRAQLFRTSRTYTEYTPDGETDGIVHTL